MVGRVGLNRKGSVSSSESTIPIKTVVVTIKLGDGTMVNCGLIGATVYIYKAFRFLGGLPHTC